MRNNSSFWLRRRRPARDNACMKPSKKTKSPRATPAEDHITSISYRLPVSALKAVDDLARKHNITRNAVFNIATSRILKDGI